VLENVAHPFVHPNVLDLKMGTLLYDLNASEEKIERMKRRAQDTTTGSEGLRVIGSRVGVSFFFQFKERGAIVHPR
jgi:inositol-polyphosphate multikinase